MLYFFKFLFLLININQETVFSWFRNKSFKLSGFEKALENRGNTDISNIEAFQKTFSLIIQGLSEKFQDGLTLSDIEGALFFILFIRFIILAIRYNLKTSFYITCISLFAGYLWYRHLIDLIGMYRAVLLKLPFLHRLGSDGTEVKGLNQQITFSTLKIGENAHWYNPGQVLYYALTKGIVNSDTKTGSSYYIDPISMAISNLDESDKLAILPIYYKIYNKIIPKIYSICSKFWAQLSGVAAYAVITRIGKKYCPYLVRWHWTCLLIISMIEPVFTYLVYRIYYFQTFVLMPQLESLEQINDISANSSEILFFQIGGLNLIITTILFAHFGAILFGLFHAIWGQYFYVPFLVENVELHIGLRPKHSYYSGGKTAWQDKAQLAKNKYYIKPKNPQLWYGWFGRGNASYTYEETILRKFKRLYFRPIRRRFKRILKKIKKYLKNN